jgi:ferredoxin
VLILVRVDRRKCMANQMCVKEAPGLFELGPDGVSRITRADPTDFSEKDLPALLRARDRCPTGAIQVETAEDAEA